MPPAIGSTYSSLRGYKEFGSIMGDITNTKLQSIRGWRVENSQSINNRCKLYHYRHQDGSKAAMFEDTDTGLILVKSAVAQYGLVNSGGREIVERVANQVMLRPEYLNGAPDYELFQESIFGRAKAKFKLNRVEGRFYAVELEYDWLEREPFSELKIDIAEVERRLLPRDKKKEAKLSGNTIKQKATKTAKRVSTIQTTRELSVEATTTIAGVKYALQYLAAEEDPCDTGARARKDFLDAITKLESVRPEVKVLVSLHLVVVEPLTVKK